MKREILEKIKNFREGVAHIFILIEILIATLILCPSVYMMNLLSEHIFPLFLVLGVLLSSVIVAVSIIRIRKRLKTGSTSSHTALSSILFVILLMLLITPQSVLIFSTEKECSDMRDHYYQKYLERLEHGESQLNAAWSITESYRNEFEGKYGKNETIPSRVVQNNLLMYLFSLFGIYLQEFDGLNKLIVVQKGGNCGEFASAVAFLLADSADLQTRVISMEGLDHAFPEVHLNDTWWVFDRIYTTQNYPVKAGDYASHLKSMGIAKYVANLRVKGTGESVLLEHGFPVFNLTVVAILDMTNNKSDDKPAANADVEIFALRNSYDPLVDRGKTDEDGRYTTVLSIQNNYVIIVKKEVGVPAVGIIEINATDISNKTVEVHLHKYE